MTNWEFPCSGPAAMSIRSWASGSVAISGEQTDVITVQVVPSHRGANVDDLLAEVQVSFDDGQLVIAGPQSSSFRRKTGLDLTIKAPTGSDCEVHTASADVACVGELGALTLDTASGDITAASASGPVMVKTASGDVFIDRADADVRVTSASGDARVAHVRGELQIRAASGDLTIGECGGSVTAHTASGDIDIKEISGGRADLEAMSGDVTITVAPGMGVYLDLSSLSGSVRSDLDETDGGAEEDQETSLEIKCRTISGDIRIRKGKAHEAAAEA
jgi:DUF4097 and DUF4098 domain-containing protein YvlB